jgi:hypothetical protein
MKIKRSIKWSLSILFILSIAGLSLWLYTIRYFSPHRWYAKKRVAAMFEALQNEDYKTAWKHCDPKGEVNTDWLKEFLQDAGISKVENFDIVWVDVYDYKMKDTPLMTVYVKINGQYPPAALAVRYNELILYAGFNRYIDI